MGSTKICSKKRLCGAEDAGRLMAALSGAAHGSLSGEGGSVKTTAGPALEPVQSLPRFARRGAGRIAIADAQAGEESAAGHGFAKNLFLSALQLGEGEPFGQQPAGQGGAAGLIALPGAQSKLSSTVAAALTRPGRMAGPLAA